MEFAFVSGSVALDFVGTVRHRHVDPFDLLASPSDLDEWIAASGLLTTATHARKADLTAAVELREAIYRLTLTSIADASLSPADCATLNRATRHAPVRQELHPDGTLACHGTLRAALATLAGDAVEVLTRPSGQVKECAAPRCSRLYVDRSHRSSRRWCDMTGCGNRAKAAAHRSRQQA